ncbi:MAG: hypothetical protein J6W14_07615 [Clostridia bacterium]|nr:hypothetical protein [Clostridia bacterium]
MKPKNIDSLIREIHDCVDRHNLGAAGLYARWKGENRINEYGCADAANILYSIGAFPRGVAERAAWISALQSLQDPATGLFREPTHHPIHTTAHCSAALELFDAAPLHPCYDLMPYTTREGLYRLLESLDWETNPWPQSHQGAGILPALTNTNMVGPDWKEDYFAWMWEHTDPENGFIYGSNRPKQAKLYAYMAGGFHYFFNHEAERRPVRYPERIIDSCLEIMAHPETAKLLHHCGFIDIDVIYCLNRATRYTDHRFAEARAALEEYAEKYIAMMEAIDYQNDKYFNDLHSLFGSVCALAELQAALPGKIITSRPLRLVLDRRPFI